MDMKALEEIKKDYGIQFVEEVKTYTLFSDDELAVQNYLQNMAQRLLGDEHDFEESPVYFGLVDDENANAFFYSNATEKDLDGNPIQKTPGIFFTKGLLEMVDNEDQLAYIMGHELGHFRQHLLRGQHSNSKTEETASDLNAVNMMARAGYNFVESNTIVNKIFGGDHVQGSFMQDILDDHPNAQSRINANEVLVTGLTKQYMKTHNVAAYNIPETKIPDEIMAIEKNEKHVSFVEEYLASEGYAELNMEEKIEKLGDLFTHAETIKSNRGYNSYIEITHPRKMDIYRECLNLVRQMREQTPKIIISQSEYDMCLKSDWDKTEEEKQRTAEIVKPFYHTFGFNMKNTIDTFPYRVVADEKLEEELKNNEDIKLQFEAKKKDGSLPQIKLFEKFYNNIDHDTDRHHSSRNEIIVHILSLAMPGVDNVSLETNDFWKSFIGLSNKFLEAKGIEERDKNSANKLRYLFDSFSYYDSTVTEVSSYAGKDFSDLLVLDSYGRKDIRIKVKGLPLPDVSVGAKVPLMNGNHLEKYMFHLDTGSKIDDKKEFVQYGQEQTEKPLTYCLIDNDRTVLKHYTSEEYRNYITEMRQLAKDEIYNSYADYVREKIEKTKAFIKNPDISSVTYYELNEMKRIVGSSGFSLKAKKADEESNEQFTYRMEKAYNEVDEETLTVYKHPLNYDNKFYELRDNHKSVFAKDATHYVETLLADYMTEEERNWVSTYNAKEDAIIFEAMSKFVKEHANNPQDIQSSMLKAGAKNHDYRSFDDYKRYPNLKTCTYFTKKQEETLMQIYLENVKLNKEYYYNDKYDSIWDVNPQNVYLGEIRNMTLFIGKNGEDAVDFAHYEPIYLEANRKILGIEAYGETTYQDYVKNERNSNIDQLLELEVFLAAVKNKGEKFPLEHASEFIDSGILGDFYIKKLEKIYANQQNWPNDVTKCAKIVNNISERRMVEPKSILNSFLNVIEKEQDPRKIEAALLKTSSLFNDNNLTEKEQNEYKDRILKGSVLWNQSLDDRILSYNILNDKNLFSEDYVLQNEMLNGFYNDINSLKDEKDKNEKLFHFITNDYRINDPDIRRKYQDAFVDSTYRLMGSEIDDNSAEYHQNIQVFIDKINEEKLVEVFYQEKTKKTVNVVDREEILRRLATKTVSQEELSGKLKPNPSGIDAFETGDMLEGHAAGIAFDVIKRDIKEDPQNAAATIDFLLSDGKLSDCAGFQNVLIERGKKAHKRSGAGTMEQEYINRLEKQTTPTKLALLHREFWGYPLEAKAVMINELLDAQIAMGDKEVWEATFDLVAERMFPNAEEGMSKIGQEFMHSYIKSRRPEQRRLYLSAMLVAANENAGTLDPEQSMAKGVRLFLENAGPAAIKLGQAMSSHPDVPKFLRDELQNLKSGAAEPARWEVYGWLRQYKAEKPDEPLKFGKDTHLGKILGSASYFVTMEKGEKNVIKILRAGAEIESEEEFKIFEKMLYDLSEKGVMQGGIDSFVRLVKQAQESVEVETNLDLGYSQLETAKEIYPKSVEINNRKFDIHVADWPQYGTRWAELEKAQGIDLEEIKDPEYKKDVSKAYFAVELMNIIGGGKFDHDRHGKQLKIDTQNNVIGLFDTGAMAIKDPDPKDKELLGKILCRSIMDKMYSPNADFSAIANSFSAEIEKVYKNKETENAYLTEVQRGLLALTDFYKDFDTKDFAECLNAVLNNPDVPVDKYLMKGFVQEGISTVGVFEGKHSILSHQDKEALGKLVFNVYSASQFAEQKDNIKNVLSKEIDKLLVADDKLSPLFGMIKNGLNEKDGSKDFALSLPPQFIPQLSEVVSQKDIDVPILKGMMKEVVTSVDIQTENPRYTAKERQEFGKVIYSAFEKIIEAKKQSKPLDAVEMFKQLCKENAGKSDLVRNMYTILDFADANQQGGDFNSNEIVKSLLLGGNLDKEITKGVTDALVEKNPNSVKRQLMAKGIKVFLSQENGQQSFVKKQLLRLFVKKNKGISQVEAMLDDKIADKSISNKFIEVLKEKFGQISGKGTEQKTKQSIKINKKSAQYG